MEHYKMETVMPWHYSTTLLELQALAHAELEKMDWVKEVIGWHDPFGQDHSFADILAFASGIVSGITNNGEKIPYGMQFNLVRECEMIDDSDYHSGGNQGEPQFGLFINKWSGYSGEQVLDMYLIHYHYAGDADTVSIVAHWDWSLRP